MLNIYKALVLGSNFGFEAHYQCLKKTFSKKNLFICSPNIKRKKIVQKNCYDSYKKVLKNNNFHTISIVTPPVIQNKLFKYISKKNKKLKFLMLEKPIAENFNQTIKLINYLTKNKIKYYVNFIFTNMEIFKFFKKKLSNKFICEVNYKWNFKQGYFVNHIKTWKINKKEGGGLINFYTIHIFYNLLFFFKNIKIEKIKKFHKKNILTRCLIFGTIEKNVRLLIDVDCNSNKSEHTLEVKTKKNTYKLSNDQKNWIKGFKIFINKKKLKKKFIKTDRKKLTLISYNKLYYQNVQRKQNNLNSKIAHYLCNKLS